MHMWVQDKVCRVIQYIYTFFQDRGNDIFGVAVAKVDDRLPIATLTYANGPSYIKHVNSTGGRKDFTKVANYKTKDYQAPALAPLVQETHGGDDVAVFANGPWAHLFTGNYEQHLIPHLMAYAANIGRNGASSVLPGLGLMGVVVFGVLRMLHLNQGSKQEYLY